MYSLRFRITPRSPLIISTISGDMNMVTTARFVPGTTVLGVLAIRFIEKRKEEFDGRPAHENDDFYHWFLSGDLKISNAYILSQDEYGEHAHHPTPLSIEQEKYGQTVYDRLVLEQEPTEPTVYVGDFCLLDEESIQTRSVETRVNFHHARDPQKGISSKGLIFNYESISNNQVFEGSVWGEESDLRDLLNVCGNKWTTFVGRSRNAQYGATEFEFIDRESVPAKKQIVWPKDEGGNPAECISMTLLSDLILYHEHGYPTTDIDHLWKELKRYVGEVVIRKAFVKNAEVENFVGVWQLKKPSEICFAAGSTFLLKIDPEDIETLIEIQQNGIGERTHEGFGRCVFGLQTHPELYLRDEAEEEAERKSPKPDGSVSDIAAEILKKIAQDVITEKFKLKAINKQEEFDRLPSNALIAKLEVMAKKAHSRSELVENINKLRNIALNQLRRCVSRKSNLLEFLAAFRLDEDSITGLEKDEIDPELYDKLKPLRRDREYVLVAELKRDLDRDLSDLEKSLLLKHARFCEDVVDWQEFFRDRRNVQLKSLCEEIKLNLEEDEALRHELLRSYFATFFSMMRKRAVSEREGYDVQP